MHQPDIALFGLPLLARLASGFPPLPPIRLMYFLDVPLWLRRGRECEMFTNSHLDCDGLKTGDILAWMLDAA